MTTQQIIILSIISLIYIYTWYKMQPDWAIFSETRTAIFNFMAVTMLIAIIMVLSKELNQSKKPCPTYTHIYGLIYKLEK